MSPRRCRKFVLLAGVSLVGTAVAQQITSASLAADMHEHLDRSGEIKSAVIAGNLDDARAAAGSLAAERMLGDLPYIEELQQHAAEAASATDLAGVGAAVGRIGRTCGGCHSASGVDAASEVEATFGRTERPARESQALTTQMQRHLWAADRLWAGLITPSDGAWQQGADILAEGRLVASDITDDPDRRVQLGALTQRMEAIGARAVQATSPDSRSQLYGEFLSLCAACHALSAR